VEIRHLQGEADCHRCIRVRVWGAGKTSRVVQADLLSKAWPAPWGACATDGAYPMAADVRAVIELALAAGWDPDAVGGVFVLTEAVHGVGWELPGFLLTDRLGDPLAADPSVRVIRSFEQRGAAVG
jgi:hypothetical protein